MLWLATPRLSGRRLAIVVALALVAVSSGWAADYQFLGYYDYKPPGEKCSSRAFETKPVNSVAEFRTMEKAFKAAHPDPVQTICWLLNPDEAAVVYEWQLKSVTGNCTITSVSHLTASTVAQAREFLAQRVAKEPKLFLTPPKIVFTWLGATGRKTTYEEDYEGVRIKFTIARLSSGTVVVAQGRNNNPAQSVLVQFEAGEKSRRVVVRPGDSFSLSLGKVDAFDVTAQKIATPPAVEKSDTDRAIDWMKARVKQHLLTPDGEFHPEKKTYSADLRG
jgi:hypothetical protein